MRAPLCLLPALVLLSLTAAGLPSSAHGQPRFVQKTVSGTPLAVPAGWTVSQTTTPVPTITLEARPGAKDSPSILIMAVPAQPGPAVAALQLVKAAMPAQAKLLKNHPLPTGGVIAEWTGAIHGIPAHMAVMRHATPNGGIVAALAAPSAQYAQLGGARFLMTVLSGKAPGAEAPATPRPGQGSVALQIPPAYAGRAKPVLDWFVDEFERIPPAQVAAGLQRLNPTEAQLLGVYGAFANLVHYRACLANAQARLPNGATCAQTAAGWRQTLQFVNNDVNQAIQQASRERGSLQVAARCGDGRSSAASCAAYRKTMSNVNRMQHETTVRIINNLGGNSCVVGDPGCVPY